MLQKTKGVSTQKTFGALCFSLFVSMPAQSIAAGLQSDLFSFTGAEQHFVVPEGVEMLNLELYGAQGGDPELGGKGGYVKADLPVIGGDILYIYVGGAGFGHSNRNLNGWNGGGRDFNLPRYILAGGGATDVRLGGNSLYDRILVAGGGGQRSINPAKVGGAGGGLVGQDGPDSSGATGGTGGSQVAGGLGGCGNIFCGARGNGSLGQGGKGDDDNGHGGGGYYGGGGGGSSGGVRRGGGGGGSSFIYEQAVEISNLQGIRAGDGQVVISYVLDSDGDGILDSLDECLNTESDATVDEQGCSIDQLCPCEGPKDSGDVWRNHGNFMACIVSSTREFVGADLLANKQRATLIRLAAKSSCGKE